VLDRPANFTAIFEFFADTTGRQERFRVSRVAYSTMKGHDLAVLALDASYSDLLRRGYRPWPSAFVLPGAREPVVIVGAPLQNNPTQSYLRLAACPLTGTARVLLERQWHWFDEPRATCRDILPGSSGSPVISRQTGRLVGIVGTTTLGSFFPADCYLGRPCEAEAGGTRVLEETSYFTPVVGIDRCFDRSGRFELARPGCPLDDARQVVARLDQSHAPRSGRTSSQSVERGR